MIDARTPAQLRAALEAVQYEWLATAELGARLGMIPGARSEADNDAMEAFLVHYRCLVNFLCGNYNGRWGGKDIRPADFLGRAWWPDDDESDRTMRGRLRVINTHLQHLSWGRVLDEDPVKWSTVFMAHEVSYEMHQFMKALGVAGQVALAEALAMTAQQVHQLLPPWVDEPQTRVPLAPAR